LRIAYNQPLRRIEHAQALRHTVDGRAHLLHFPRLRPSDRDAEDSHYRLRDDRGTDGREHGCWGSGDQASDPSRSKKVQGAEG
jgi:hypothetical protein